MTIWHTFADEAGNFDFSRKANASRYFVLCTVTIDTCAVGNALLALRRELAWDGHNRDTVFQQITRSSQHCVVAWPTSSDPCLQVADYCTWAIQRKWERQDLRSYALISSKICSEYDIWQLGQDRYY